jgi:hypothetical protein
MFMFKNEKEQNVVQTTTLQNLGAAKECETYQKACLLFRRLEHANNRSTRENVLGRSCAFDILETHFMNKMGLSNYIKEGF